ncbi:cysteine hydrolase family protein [Aspergillus homomorphus CBS 101889]|uniref:Isochorismatase family protein n=1 Tax=Aspergillus homomorphus (strain CBS 101889) TaxID=1450537 RepID=A0A395HKK0_ASPHC|nr:isochorismatase family protein [Aspergillus homomorphus CBS 101889]RAL08029.1 isochorismatase family protein [Aspergillus homomorphus CBS 101889]
MAPKASVLVVLDVQYGAIAGFPNADDYIRRLETTIKIAREAHVPIIYAKLGFSPGFSEVPADKESMVWQKELFTFKVNDPTAQVHPAVAPAETDHVINRTRLSAFAHTNLAITLRGLRVDEIVPAGLKTSEAVLATVMQAGDWDYRVTVLKDFCMDRDKEMHNLMVNRVLPRHATVCTQEEWVEDLLASSKGRDVSM